MKTVPQALVRLLAVTGACVVLLQPRPALASCVADAGPDGAPVVFVGVAGGERRGYTRFDVEEVRVGPDLAPEVWVRSGQEQPRWPMSMFVSVASSNDADFTPGRRYVVGASRSYDTGACTVAAAGTRSHPPDARTPVAGGSTGADPPISPLGQTLWLVGGAGAVGAAGAAVLRVRGRRRAGATGHEPA